LLPRMPLESFPSPCHRSSRGHSPDLGGSVAGEADDEVHS
jgi:hypothetical protein